MIFFGKQWEKSIIAFKILSLSIWFQITNSSTGAIYASINKTKLLLKSGMIYIPLQIFLIISVIGKKSIELVAAAATVGLISKFFIDYIILIKKGFGYSIIKFLQNFKFELILFITCYCSMSLGKIIRFENDIVIFIYNLLLCGITFLVGLILTRQIKCLKL